jgi:acyl dehydratase
VTAVLTGPPEVGAAVGPLHMFLSLQRLIMVSGANRDYAMSHVDNEAARAGGAESAYADVMFVFTMVDRLLLEWAGPDAVLRAIGPMALREFVLSGHDLEIRGVVTDVSPASLGGRDGLDVSVDVEFVQGERRPVLGRGRLWTPATSNGAGL